MSLSENLKITAVNNSLRVNLSNLATMENLSVEVSRAVSVETMLLNTISTEVSNVGQRITNVVGAAPDLLDTLAEIATALSNDPSVVNVLQSGIQLEVSRAVSVETSLGGVLNGEVSRAVSVEASLSVGLSSEISRALSVDASLSVGLSSEVSRATSALSGNINCAALSCTTLVPSSLITSTKITEVMSLAGGSGTSWTTNFNVGNLFYATPTGNFTVTIDNIPVSSLNQYTITLISNASNYCTGATVTGIATTFRNVSNAAPTISSAAIVVHNFTIIQCFSTKYVIYNASPY
jgi:hypothetical protein